MAATAAAAAAAAAAARVAAAARGGAAALISSSSSSSSRYLAVRAFSSSSSSSSGLKSLLQQQRFPLHHHHPAQPQQQHRSSSSSSSSSSTAAAAESLSNIIQKEITHEKAQQETDKELQLFLNQNNWEIEDKDNDVLVVLKKDVNGFRVTVEFSCIQPSGGDEEETVGDSSDFTVSVCRKGDSKGDSNEKGLLFYCSTTNEDENARFCIGQIRYFSDTASKESLSVYPGPYFEDLDESFQRSLDSFLASLGIDGSLCNFIDGFAAEKENKEYIRWLNQIHNFVQNK